MLYCWAHTTAVLNRFSIIFHPLTLKMRLPELTLLQAPLLLLLKQGAQTKRKNISFEWFKMVFEAFQ